MVICLKAFVLPLLLIISIEAAIFINMSIAYFGGVTLPFEAPIVLGTIELGATIDYAILLTTTYREERKNMDNVIKFEIYKSDAAKLIFSKKAYLSRLCDVLGSAHELRDYLKEMEYKYPFLKIVIRKDIENLSKLSEQYDQAAEEAYQDWLVMKEEEISHRGGCFDCPQGNGEGGCTIPGYCLKYDIEE